ncbi:MAG: ribonuclease HI family protein [Patescibacteria group bacterium]
MKIFSFMEKNIKIFTDGGARGNPGPAGIGFVIQDAIGKIIFEFGKYIGETTNNQAEYKALLMALEKALELKLENVNCYLDSELVVKQLKGEYKVKDKDLGILFVKIWNLSQKFKSISYTHILREKNKRADWLVNEALDTNQEKNN